MLALIFFHSYWLNQSLQASRLNTGGSRRHLTLDPHPHAPDARGRGGSHGGGRAGHTTAPQAGVGLHPAPSPTGVLHSPAPPSAAVLHPAAAAAARAEPHAAPACWPAGAAVAPHAAPAAVAEAGTSEFVWAAWHGISFKRFHDINNLNDPLVISFSLKEDIESGGEASMSSISDTDLMSLPRHSPKSPETSSSQAMTPPPGPSAATGEQHALVDNSAEFVVIFTPDDFEHLPFPKSHLE